jgi:hypothetical protein
MTCTLILKRQALHQHKNAGVRRHEAMKTLVLIRTNSRTSFLREKEEEAKALQSLR